MTKPRISQVLVWTLALVTLALFGFFVALVAGALPVGEPDPPRDSGALLASQTEPADQPAATAVTKRVQVRTAGYYPLPPWAGLAVLVGYAVAGLAVAAVLLNRRDA